MRLRAPPFLFSMDSAAWRAILVTLALFASIAAVFLFGKTALGVETERELQRWLGGFSDSPWGLPAVIVLFTASAFIGAPQFVLIAACVVAFGPLAGLPLQLGRDRDLGGGDLLCGPDRGRPLARPVRRRHAEAAGRGSWAATPSSVPSSSATCPRRPLSSSTWRSACRRPASAASSRAARLGFCPRPAWWRSSAGPSSPRCGGTGVWTSAILAGVGALWLCLMLGARALLQRRARAEETT
jgi:hypothetical protein